MNSNCIPYDVTQFPAIGWEEGRDCWLPTGPSNARDAFDLMPDGTKVSLCVLADYDGFIGADGAILQGQVGDVAYFGDLRHATLHPYQYETLFPYALWLRVDAASPLLLGEGEEITPAVLAQLEEFDIAAPLNTRRPLAIPAAKRVEAVLLLAPDWALPFKNLKVRG